MGLLDNTTHQDYYQGNDHGNYQFTSLDDIITQFIVAYVGEDKIISKIKRTDVAFHAQRAMQELSFDTFKSCKSYQIDVPASLKMILPHDYVNYTKISWVDGAGIKHLLYPASKTNNPFQINQLDSGDYSFPNEAEEIIDGDFAAGNYDAWNYSQPESYSNEVRVKSEMSNGALQFSHGTRNMGGTPNPQGFGYTAYVYQELDVSDKELVNLSANGLAKNMVAAAVHKGVLRVGLSTSPPDVNNLNFLSHGSLTRTTNSNTAMFNVETNDGDSAYLEWTVAVDGTSATDKELTGINLAGINTVYLIVISFQEAYTSQGILSAEETNVVDNISITNTFNNNMLTAKLGNETNSSTWNSYKSATPSENNNDDYEDDTYWPANGERYGLDPQHAQANGSFYIDCRSGKIHFSSNISGKTVILDYISDSLGTDAEMQVHKFAEEAMYKWLAHAILSTRANTQEYIVQRFKKERFAAIRTAKLRLSNIKLEEITQILRGKSKHIKH